MACVNLTTEGNDNYVEGPEWIGFSLGESSNVPGAVAHGNTVELIINDNGKVGYLSIGVYSFINNVSLVF